MFLITVLFGSKRKRFVYGDAVRVPTNYTICHLNLITELFAFVVV